MNAITDEHVNDVNFIARDSYDPNRKILGMLQYYLILIIVENLTILMELAVAIEML